MAKVRVADYSSALHGAIRIMAVIAITFLASACGKKETVQTPTAPVSPPPAVISDVRIEAELAKALEPTRDEVRDTLADEAEDILDQYPNKNVTDLLNVPEVNPSLKIAITGLAEDKGLQNKINSTVELAAQMKGLEGNPGSVGLDLDTKNYNRDQKSRILQAVLSEDPKRIVDFLVSEIGEAAPELSLGGVARASNGIAIKENQPPAK